MMYYLRRFDNHVTDQTHKHMQAEDENYSWKNSASHTEKEGIYVLNPPSLPWSVVSVCYKTSLDPRLHWQRMEEEEEEEKRLQL